jgi:hypothetical protein
LYNEQITFKKGDRVKATGKSYYENDLSEGATGTVKDPAYKSFTGTMAVVVTWDNPDDRNFDLFLPDHLELVKPQKASKVAKILTEKVMVGDVKCRKILGFENITTFNDIPDIYLRDAPFFYIWSNGGSEMVLKPERGERIHLNIGNKIPEIDFQYYIQQMKKAGERLGTINKKIRSDKDNAEKAKWSGCETVEI